ncbi:amidase [Agrobacterium sp. LAD9]|uniref:amidase n=1 Tax=Agrobacterium sp. LAD9 TaxID=2055153 RepID=UPI000D1F6172|nr:amidase [Agrobacterium sp. LAD9]
MTNEQASTASKTPTVGMKELATSASATELSNLLREKEISPVELLEATIEGIEEKNHIVNAFVHLGFDEARELAKKQEGALLRGDDLGPLGGVPVAMKDLYDFKVGWPSTLGGVPALRNNIATFNSLWVERMEKAGANIVGKTNAAIFGFRGTGDNPLFGPSKNPFDLSYNSGGSSGGAAAAVAAGLVSIGQATDGGGSTRVPAAFCGLVGLKPTFGRIPMPIRPNAFGGTSPFLFDGAVTRTIEDSAIALEVLEGYDSRDPFVSRGPKVDRSEIRGDVKGLRIAFSRNLDTYPIEDEIDEAMKRAVAVFEDAGAIVEEVKLGFTADHLEIGELWGHLIVHSQIEGLNALKAAGIDLLGDHPEQFCDLHRYWIDKALKATTLERHQHQILRTMIYEKVQAVLDSYDVLITPTTALLGIKNNIGGDTIGPTEIKGVPVEPLIGFALTSYFNYTGHPALSVPVGLSSGGLPIGMQIVGNRFEDGAVLNAGRFVEKSMPWDSIYKKIQLAS